MSTDLVIAPKPRAPVCSRHFATLRQLRLDGTPQPIADNDCLIPLADCQAILAEMDEALAGTPPADATLLALKILGAYPNARPDDPDAYLESVVAAIVSCPPDLHRELYRRITQRPTSFSPVAGEFSAAIADLTRSRRGAIAVAKAHIRAHARRGSEKPARRWADLTPEEKAQHDLMMAQWRAAMAESRAEASR